MDIEFIKPESYIYDQIEQNAVVDKIETAARICYQSQNVKPRGELLRQLIKSKHETPLEHVSVTAYIETDQGVLRELTRHRLNSFSVSSTRYINYNKHAKFVIPTYLYNGYRLYNNSETSKPSQFEDSVECGRFITWRESIKEAYNAYCNAINAGQKPQEARSVLPMSTACQMYMTANLRQWTHIFNLRILGTTGAPHPDMVATLTPLYQEFRRKLPIIFGEPE